MFVSINSASSSCEIMNPIRITIGNLRLQIPAKNPPTIIQKDDARKSSRIRTRAGGIAFDAYCSLPGRDYLHARRVIFNPTYAKYYEQTVGRPLIPIGVSNLSISEISGIAKPSSEGKTFEVIEGNFRKYSYKDGYYFVETSPEQGELAITANCFNPRRGDFTTCRIRKKYQDLQIVITIDVHASSQTVLGDEITQNTWPYRSYAPAEWPRLFSQVLELLAPLARM